MSKESYIYRERMGNGFGAPLLFLFHGTGGDEDQFFDVGGQLLPGAHLIALRGDVSEHGALRYFRRTGEGQYDMPDLATRTEKLRAFIAAHIGEKRPRAVFGLGYSNGANILASVMFSSPELVDGAVLLHPLIPYEPPSSVGFGGRRVMITAGRRDPIAPAATTDALEGYFSRAGASVETVWHAGGHELASVELEAATRFFQSDAGDR
jgi:phospholipase/carboxylesterase